MIGLISVEFINKKAAQNVHNPLNIHLFLNLPIRYIKSEGKSFNELIKSLMSCFRTSKI